MGFKNWITTFKWGGISPEVKAIPGKVWTGTKYTALALGVGAAALYLTSTLRSNRRYDPDKQPEPDAGQDLPPVFDPMAMPPPQTLAGQPLVTNGPLATQVLARRGGLSAGPDFTPPNTEGPGGNSLIDGKPVDSLGAVPAR